MRTLRRSAVLFVAVGLALYAGVYAAAERLQYATGRSNPLFKIATAPHAAYDWVILGASHAMPLDFADVNATIEERTGQRILNLAATGAGPLYNRFVLEHFLRARRARRARNLLYVVDAFAFLSPVWNEERFTDVKLLRRTPFDSTLAVALAAYSRRDGVDPRAVLDYVSGFSKINNRERFIRDVWDGEAQFERVFRPSSTATRKRIDYLYPAPADAAAALARYMAVFADLVALAQRQGVAVTVRSMPLPQDFRRRLPDEAAFAAMLTPLLAAAKVEAHDFSAAMPETRFYFDTDHLNRAGVSTFVDRHLAAILADR